jgi:hypothetical protein
LESGRTEPQPPGTGNFAYINHYIKLGDGVLSALETALQSLSLRWYLFGAQAAIVHGSSRLTADVDATIDLVIVRNTLLDLETALERSDLVSLLERILTVGGSSAD